MVGMALAQINTMTAEAAVGLLGGVFENSPWVAEGALERRPFTSAAQLHGAMTAVVDAADEADKLALLGAHPELAGADARKKLISAESINEQGIAGLDALSDRQQADFDRMNTEYRERFGFPFIVAVRNHTMASILETFRARLANSRGQELEAALAQVYEIARIRLEELTGEPIPRGMSGDAG